jgi:hypothetical protein
MTKLKSLTEFKELRNDAIKNKKLKKANLLIGDEELSLHIENGNVKYEMHDDCLCVVITKHNTDYLHFWLTDANAAFIPDVVNPIVFHFYGMDNTHSIWEEVAENIGLSEITRAHKISAKVSDIKNLAVPKRFRDMFEFKTCNICSYEYFKKITAEYFEPITTMFPEEYEWELYLKNFTLIECFDKQGNLAGYIQFHHKGKVLTDGRIAVNEKYRKLGIFQLLIANPMANFEKYCGWIEERNKNSILAHQSLNILKESAYYAFYGGQNDCLKEKLL